MSGFVLKRSSPGLEPWDFGGASKLLAYEIAIRQAMRMMVFLIFGIRYFNLSLEYTIRNFNPLYQSSLLDTSNSAGWGGGQRVL